MAGTIHYVIRGIQKILFCGVWIFCFLGASVAQTKIVALGDSLTAGYGLAPRAGFVPQLEKILRTRGHNVKIVNAGVSGDTTSGGLARLEWAVPQGTHGVILELGANDALRGIDPQITRRNLTAIVEKLQARGIKILLAGMRAPPNLGKDYETAFNAIFPTLAKRYRLVYYPFFLDGVAAQKKFNLDDGIHPNEAGVKVIVFRILPTVERLLTEVNQ